MKKIAAWFKKQDKGVKTLSVLIALAVVSTGFLGTLTLFNNTGSDVSVADGDLKTYSFNESNEYLENPGIGWQYMDGSNKSLLPETVSYPDRQDIAWYLVNPQDNQYDWNVLDQHINAAKSAGKQTSFRIYTARGEGFGGNGGDGREGHQMPDYVVNKGAKLINGTPDFSDCIYQEEWGQFVDALRERYDGNDTIAFIDISGYDNFNEWSYGSQTVWDDTWNDAFQDYRDNNGPLPTRANIASNNLDSHSRIRLSEMFMGGSATNHKCKQNGSAQTKSYNYQGFQETQLIMPYAGSRQALEYVMLNGPEDIGFRNDCLGAPGYGVDYYTEQGSNPIAFVMEDRWQTAPVVFELCQINWGNSNFVSRMENVLQYTHGSTVHDNPNGGSQPQQTIENAMKRAGYRYFFESVSIPETTSGSITYSANFKNTGYARNYPKMGQDFTAKAYLMNGNTVVKEWNIETDVESWWPADNYGDTIPTNTVAGDLSTNGVAQGTYSFGLGIYDTRLGKNINLANTTEIGSTDVYKVADITIGEGGGDTIADAGFELVDTTGSVSYNQNDTFDVAVKVVDATGVQPNVGQIELTFDDSKLAFESFSKGSGILGIEDPVSNGTFKIDVAHSGPGFFENGESLITVRFKVITGESGQAAVTVTGNSTIGDQGGVQAVDAVTKNITLGTVTTAGTSEDFTLDLVPTNAESTEYEQNDTVTMNVKVVDKENREPIASEIEITYNGSKLSLESFNAAGNGVLTTTPETSSGKVTVGAAHSGTGFFNDGENLVVATFKVLNDADDQIPVTLTTNSTIGDEEEVFPIYQAVIRNIVTVKADTGGGGGGGTDPEPFCGDGEVDPDEDCDNGDDNADSGAVCSTSCTFNAACNDGVDNDSDGKTDCTPGAEDLGCYPDGMGGGGSCSTADTDETDVEDNGGGGYTPATCYGDYNEDTKINILDFAIFAQNYKVNLPADTCERLDLVIEDGLACRLRIADFNFMIDRYGKSCSELPN